MHKPHTTPSPLLWNGYQISRNVLVAVLEWINLTKHPPLPAVEWILTLTERPRRCSGMDKSHKTPPSPPVLEWIHLTGCPPLVPQWILDLTERAHRCSGMDKSHTPSPCSRNENIPQNTHPRSGHAQVSCFRDH